MPKLGSSPGSVQVTYLLEDRGKRGFPFNRRSKVVGAVGSVGAGSVALRHLVGSLDQPLWTGLLSKASIGLRESAPGRVLRRERAPV
jgi:hypothetical protein